ncbi:hypothetical protein [Arthrobacter sp. 18067]|uniref:hypothetical protein n=1 Tax=Arthrobacter sp. 18067 TaxID=2681413 RepID=UPI0013598FC4|nr:hypothetical protein [Arthrobacter sp. 18067]
MRLIEIEQVLVNPEHVAVVEPVEGGSKIHFQNGTALTSSLAPLEISTRLQGMELLYDDTVVHGG